MAKSPDQPIQPQFKPDGIFHNTAHVESMKAMMNIGEGESEVQRVAAAYGGRLTANLKLNLAHRAWRELTE